MKLQKLALGVAAWLGVQSAEASNTTAPELVDVAKYVHNLIVRKPYATTENFTGKVIYPGSDSELVSVCKLQPSGAQKLQRANEELKSLLPGARFMAWDCYRPPEVQTVLWNAYGCDSDPTKCAGYIAPPGRSQHNRGLAIDITLADPAGNPLPMPTEYDTFSQIAHSSSRSQWSLEAQRNWDAMNTALTRAGCTVNSSEWWHYDC